MKCQGKEGERIRFQLLVVPQLLRVTFYTPAPPPPLTKPFFTVHS